jgi:hypothetical protein
VHLGSRSYHREIEVFHDRFRDGAVDERLDWQRGFRRLNLR